MGLVQILGGVLLGVVLVQAVVAVVGSLRRLMHERAQQHLALTLLENQVAAARARRRELEEEQEIASWKGYRKFEVMRRRRETEDICSFYLAPHDGKPLPPFRPGQYLTFQLQIPDPQAKRGSTKPTVRCYSLSEAPNSRYYRVSIKRVPAADGHLPGRASTYFHGRVGAGDILDVKAPAGNFSLDLERQTPLVLIAGGVGVTPLISMVNTLVKKGLEREVWFFYGVTCRAEAMRVDALEALHQANYWLRLHVCYSRPAPGDVADPDIHATSRVDVEFLKSRLPSNNYEFYICGPAPMMESLTTGLRSWGVPDDHVFYEAFGPASVKKAAATGKTILPTTKKLRVKFAKSETESEWNGEVGSLLELAEEHEVPIDSGCRAGNCGTCLTAIREGTVEYVVPPTSVPEPGTCLTCIAVPTSDLELEA